MNTQDVINAIVAQPILSGVKTEVASVYKLQEDAPNRIVFVPLRARYEMAEPHRTRNPRTIRTRVVSYEARIWAQGSGSVASDLDAAETMLNNLIAAIHQTIGDYRLEGDQYAATQGQEDANAGILLVLGFELRVPVTLPAETAVTLVGSGAVPGTSAVIVPTSEMEFPNGNVVSGSPAP